MEVKKVNRQRIVNKLSDKQVKNRLPSTGSKKTVGRSKGILRKPKPPLDVKKHQEKESDTVEPEIIFKIPDERSTWYENESQPSNDLTEGSNSNENDDNERIIEFLSPNQMSDLQLDNTYDISDNGIEELTNAFLTDFPGTNSFFERLDLLDNLIDNIQEETRPPRPKPILKRRAASAVTKREAVKFLTPEQEFHEKYVRPYSAGCADKSSRYLRINQKDVVPENIDETDNKTKDPDLVLEPFVFGYRSRRQMCVYEQEEDKESSCTDMVLTVPTGKNNIDNISDEEDNDPMGIPSTIQHFLPYRTCHISKNVIGVDPDTCLVFLPCLETMREPLKVVPPPQKPDEELNYTEKIYPPKKKKKRKKYDHPWRSEVTDEWQCYHGSQQIITPRIQIIADNGNLLHESYDRYRGPDVIRKEIQELEDLMKGKGSFDGCVVVQFQAEINEIQETIQEMLPRMEEIERREDEKNAQSQPEDIFGMKTFYREHGDVMRQIRHQHRLCVLELSALEEELELEDEDKHFLINRRVVKT